MGIISACLIEYIGLQMVCSIKCGVYTVELVSQFKQNWFQSLDRHIIVLASTK